MDFNELSVAAHDLMMPRQVSDEERTLENPRKSFRDDIIKNGREIALDLIGDGDWRRIFNDVENFESRRKLSQQSTKIKSLQDAARHLEQDLKKFHGCSAGQPLLVVAMDEISNILRSEESGDITQGLYVALNRVISCLKDFRIWFFFLSTESRIDILVPIDGLDHQSENFVERTSSRSVINVPDFGTDEPKMDVLKRVPPFFGLEMNIGIKKRMSKAKDEELKTPVCDFASERHMALFGRPLWSASSKNADRMIALAKKKIVGSSNSYNPDDPHHVFAVLSFRLSLDVCVQNTVSLPLSRTAVNSFMRTIVQMDQELGVLNTRTPAEPVLAKAAMIHLCDENNIWRRSIRTWIGDLLEKGLVSKGMKGELFVRFVLVLAHDIIRRKNFPTTFSVSDFLDALFGDSLGDQIKKINQQILDAKMNFSYFTATNESLSTETTPSLLRDLMSCMAALQLAPEQEMFDLLIPCQTGSGADAYDESKSIVVAIQVKNRIRRTQPERVFGVPFASPEASQGRASRSGPKKRPSFLFNLKMPHLFLLFDLDPETAPGNNSSTVQVKKSVDKLEPELWCIESRGHGSETFGCLKTMACEEVAADFFNMIVKTDQPDLHDRISETNWMFKSLNEEFRYGEPPAGSAAQPATGQEPDQRASKGHKRRDNQGSNVGSSSGPQKRAKTKATSEADDEEP